jgi:hypothetical protein
MVLKKEHDQIWLKTLNETEQNLNPKVITAYEKLKDEIKKPIKYGNLSFFYVHLKSFVILHMFTEHLLKMKSLTMIYF